MKLLGLATLLIGATLGQFSGVLPKGYRVPIESDYIDDWKAFRKELPEPFVAGGDFNNDGATDEAWLLPGTFGGFGLFAFMGSADGAGSVVRLAGAKELKAQWYGIETVLPGQYKTACGKGYWACEPGEPAILTLTAPAILFQRFESSSSIFWWNAGSGRFTRTWISD